MCFMKMPNVSMPTVTTTARDLVPERTNTEPEAPIYGGSDETYATSAKKKGISSLQIKPFDDYMSRGYNPVNGSYGSGDSDFY